MTIHPVLENTWTSILTSKVILWGVTLTITFWKNQGIETRLNAYGPLYVKKLPKYWSNLGESFIKAQNATT